jgi:hypothetical protein
MKCVSGYYKQDFRLTNTPSHSMKEIFTVCSKPSIADISLFLKIAMDKEIMDENVLNLVLK